jgi:hypothetical protein
MNKGRPKSTAIKVGDVYNSTSFGAYEVIEVNHARDILCRFVDTGFEIRKQAAHIKSGCVKDYLKPSILGVGFFGVGMYSSKMHKESYQKWKNMLTRCYDEKYQLANPTYKGCTVCDEWHDFQAFAEWYYINKPTDGAEYHLDKDLKATTASNKVYSPLTCTFLIPQRNVEVSHSISAKLTSPQGEVVKVYNVSGFCRENGLSQAHISSVLNGKRKTHKGWLRAPTQP